MSLKGRIENDLKEAMKAKDSLKVSCLRLIKSAFKNKEIELMGALKEDQELALLSTLVKQRKESIEQFHKGDRKDLASKEEAELKIIEGYLPAQLSEVELEKIIVSVIQEVGASTPKEMGKVMKALLPKITGKADGKLVSQLVQKKLKG